MAAKTVLSTFTLGGFDVRVVRVENASGRACYASAYKAGIAVFALPG